MAKKATGLLHAVGILGTGFLAMRAFREHGLAQVDADAATKMRAQIATHPANPTDNEQALLNKFIDDSSQESQSSTAWGGAALVAGVLTLYTWNKV